MEKTKKNYLDEIDRWIETRLHAVNGATDNASEIIAMVKEDIKAKMRESYFNGRGKRATGSDEKKDEKS